jgi:CDI immunity proteins
MPKKDIEDQTIEELENDFWPEPSAYPTGLIKDVHSIRKKKLVEMDSNDVRLLISQNIGLEYLIPKAIKILRVNVLEDALYYPGDLLTAVLSIKNEYWIEHTLEKEDVTKLIFDSKVSISSTTEIYDKEILRSIIEKIDKFCNLSN